MEFPFKRHQPEQIIEIVRGRFQNCDNCPFLSILACKGWQFRWTWTLVLNKRITRARVGSVSDKACLRHSIRYVLNFPMKLLSESKARLAALPRSTVFMVVHRVRYFFEVRKSWLAPLHRDKPHFAGNCLRDKFTRKQHHPLWPRNHKVARLVSFCVGGWASFNVINYKPSSLDPLSCVCSGILALYVLLPLLMLLMPKWLSGKEKEPASLCPFCWFALSRGSLFDKSLNLTAKKNTKKKWKWYNHYKFMHTSFATTISISVKPDMFWLEGSVFAILTFPWAWGWCRVLRLSSNHYLRLCSRHRHQSRYTFYLSFFGDSEISRH